MALVGESATTLKLVALELVVAPVSFVTFWAFAPPALVAKGDMSIPCRPSRSSMKLKVIR